MRNHDARKSKTLRIMEKKMKYLILLCSLSQFIVAAENIHTIQRPPTLSDFEAIIFEKKFMEASFDDILVEDARRIVQYLIGTGKETYTSLIKKLNETTSCGPIEENLRYFEQGFKGWGDFTDYLKIYYDKTRTSLVSPPPVPETHWYDIFWSSRPSSGSSEGSKKNDRTATYRVTDEKQGQSVDDDHTSAKEDVPLIKKKNQ
jgi:hypothetical protein